MTYYNYNALFLTWLHGMHASFSSSSFFSFILNVLIKFALEIFNMLINFEASGKIARVGYKNKLCRGFCQRALLYPFAYVIRCMVCTCTCIFAICCNSLSIFLHWWFSLLAIFTLNFVRSLCFFFVFFPARFFCFWITFIWSVLSEIE